MSTFINTLITGAGSHIPSEEVPNSAFEKNEFYEPDGTYIDKPGEEITSKFEAITGIAGRRYAPVGVYTSDLGADACKKALEASGASKEEIDHLITAHNNGDVEASNRRSDIMPSIGARIKHKLGIENPGCVPYDVIFGCPGWVQGCIQAHLFMQAGSGSKSLVVGCETLSRVVDPFDRDAMIFADGAGAAVLETREESERRGVLAFNTVAHTQEELNFLASGKSNNPAVDHTGLIKMKGRKIYEYALEHVPAAIAQTIEKAGLHLNDINMMFLHQANEKMDAAITKRLFRKFGMRDVPADFMPMSIHKLGNSSVATVPTLWDMVMKGEMAGHSLQQGNHVVFASVGAGMSINAFVYKL
ncbi:MAG: ketoacyl-ACP synthase III [Flavobacteriales bacterium]|nr:ketoacyl-ACP synthase III [Flavobacteriales bacterium]